MSRKFRLSIRVSVLGMLGIPQMFKWVCGSNFNFIPKLLNKKKIVSN